MTRTIALFAGLFAASPALAQTLTAGFEGLTPTRPYSNSAGAAGYYENGQNLSGSFASGGATFNNRYNPTYDSWSGFSFSTVKDTTTAGYMNQYAAYAPSSATTGAGAGGSATYAVAYGASSGRSVITLPDGYRPDSIQVTNTTYAAQSLLNGDSFAKKFGGASGNDPDSFLLTVFGKDAAGASTGSKTLYLADYRFEDNTKDYVVSNWTTLSLAGLTADTRSLTFSLTSTDVGQYGMNTPAYFAADDLVMSLTPTPEPAATGLVAAGGLGVGWLWRRKRRAA